MTPAGNRMRMRNPYAALNVQRGEGDPLRTSQNGLDALGQSSITESARRNTLDLTTGDEFTVRASLCMRSAQKNGKPEKNSNPAAAAAAAAAAIEISPNGASHQQQPNSSSNTTPHHHSNLSSLGVGKTTDAFCNTTAADNKPLLTHLLPQLRPFQREALEFAVEGKRYGRQFIVANAESLETDDSVSHSTPAAAADHVTKDCFPVGQGRILLGDEMGLGACFVYCTV
jgi:hypothetical protein